MLSYQQPLLGAQPVGGPYRACANHQFTSGTDFTNCSLSFHTVLTTALQFCHNQALYFNQGKRKESSKKTDRQLAMGLEQLTLNPNAVTPTKHPRLAPVINRRNGMRRRGNGLLIRIKHCKMFLIYSFLFSYFYSFSTGHSHHTTIRFQPVLA